MPPVSGVNLLGFAQKCQEIEDFSHACLQQSVDSENTAAALQRFFSENWLNIAQIAPGWSRDGESESGQLQHSRKVDEKLEAVSLRRTLLDKGDSHIFWRSTRSDLNLTKSDVKVTANNRSESPVKSTCDSHSVWSFTPDTGVKRVVGNQTITVTSDV